MAPARLYHAGRLLLPAPALPGVDAVATIDDRIVAVGSVADCTAALPHDHQVVDLAGCALAPGFVDAHVHPMIMCVFERELLLDECTSVAEVLDLVADRSRAGSPERTVVGFQLDDAALAEQRLPTAAELDAASGGRRVVLVRRDGHHAVGSVAALRAAGFDATGTEPVGGVVERDGAGRPTGLVRETAVAPLLALMDDLTLDDLQAGLRAWSDRLLRQGVTAISAMCQTTEEGPSGPAGTFEAVGWSVLADGLPFDIQTILIAPELGAVHDQRSGSPLHDPVGRRRVDAVKLFLDGTLGGHTACMHQAFSDRPGSRGLRTLGDDDAYERMVAAHVAGLQICVHAIGDQANRDAAELFGRLLREHPGEHRHRVEHASVLDAPTIERFAEHGLTVVVQPVNLHSERHWLERRVGPDRLARTYPFRSLLDAGVVVAGSSDAPIERTDVIEAMAASVDRGGLADAQSLTPAEALAIYTTGGSWARSTEHELGAIRPGSRADLVVLSADPTTASPADAAAIRVLTTTIGGVDLHIHPDAPAVAPRESHR